MVCKTSLYWPTMLVLAMEISSQYLPPCSAGFRYQPGCFYTYCKCIPCDAGTYGYVPNSYQAVSVCYDCPVGTFSNPAAVACTPCGKGTYNPTTRGAGPQACLACPEGEPSVFRFQGIVGFSGTRPLNFTVVFIQAPVAPRHRLPSARVRRVFTTTKPAEPALRLVLPVQLVSFS
jgi:hypothetical protein